MRVRSPTRASSVISNWCCNRRTRNWYAAHSIANNEHRAERTKPVRLVVGRHDREFQFGCGFVPDSVAVRSHHAKCVFPGRQIRVKRLPARTGFAPITIVAVEPITEFHLLWISKGGRSVIDLQVARMRREPEVIDSGEFLSVNRYRLNICHALGVLFGRPWTDPASIRHLPARTKRDHLKNMPPN